MTPRTIVVCGARGGHGATTVAAALALHSASQVLTALVSPDAAATAALIGIPLGLADEWVQVTPTLVLTADRHSPCSVGPKVVVVDAGPCEAAQEPVTGAERYVVLRGPCYVALASLLAAPQGRVDGIILVAEDGRSLTARDVTEVLDVPVVATVTASSDVARTIDAGLLVSRIHRLRALAPLRTLASDPYAGRPRPSTARPRQRPPNGSGPGTDLPLSQCDNGADRSRAVKSVALHGLPTHVEETCRDSARRHHAEHRAACAGRGRLLHRRGRHVGRGLLHRQG